jgi:undecaprenyl pyrophosphate synthase
MIQNNYTQKSKPKKNNILKHITIIYKSNKKWQEKEIKME